VQLDPELAEAHAARGYALAIVRRFEEAWPAFEIATRLNPALFETWYLHARADGPQGISRRPRGSSTGRPRFAPRTSSSLALGATAWEGQGDHEEAGRRQRQAIARVERRLELHPNDVRALYLGAIACTRTGDGARGELGLGRANALDPDDPSPLYNIACACALMGRPDRALDCLDRCFAMGLAHQDWIAHDPDLDSLRGLPRFEALVARHRDRPT
jgi:adenylate cyclase